MNNIIPGYIDKINAKNNKDKNINTSPEFRSKLATEVCLESPNQIGAHVFIKNKGITNNSTKASIKKKPKDKETKAEKKINLATNNGVPGKPIVISIIKKEKLANNGLEKKRPETSVKSLELNLFEMHSIKKNSNEVVILCATTKKIATCSNTTPPTPKHIPNQFISITVVKATIRFKSLCANNLNVAITNPKKQKPTNKEVKKLPPHNCKIL